MTQLNVEVAPKRLEFLRELVPKANAMALLVNPANAALAETQSNDLLSAASALGLELHFLNASSERDFDAVFTDVIKLRAGGLVISTDPLFTSWTKHLATLAAHHGVPAAFARHDHRDRRSAELRNGPASTLAASSRGKTPPVSRSSSQRKSSRPSISKPPRRSG